MEEKEDEEHEYKNNNTKNIYNEDIDQEELDGILEDTKRNPNFHKEKDKEIDEYAE